MKIFLYKMTLLTAAFVALHLILLFAIPKDKNAYLCAYNSKIQLLKTTPQPRIIFIGGSNVAFGMNSKAISDSLHYNVINFGLHGGIGIRYPLEDALQYIQNGDIVVLQFTYENFWGADNGNRDTFTSFMMSTNWQNPHILHIEQWMNIITGIPKCSVLNMMRLLKYPIYKSLDTPTTATWHLQAASGFNEYGDEVKHFSYPSQKWQKKKEQQIKKINTKFTSRLSDIIKQYEQAGAKVILLPPVCIKSQFTQSYNCCIEKMLDDIHHPYIVPPSSMVLDDSCMFDFGYHVNKEGCYQNTQNIIHNLYHLKDTLH